MKTIISAPAVSTPIGGAAFAQDAATATAKFNGADGYEMGLGA
jgi:hypothetical protein